MDKARALKMPQEKRRRSQQRGLRGGEPVAQDEGSQPAQGCSGDREMRKAPWRLGNGGQGGRRKPRCPSPLSATAERTHGTGRSRGQVPILPQKDSVDKVGSMPRSLLFP